MASAMTEINNKLTTVVTDMQWIKEQMTEIQKKQDYTNGRINRIEVSYVDKAFCSSKHEGLSNREMEGYVKLKYVFITAGVGILSTILATVALKILG